MGEQDDCALSSRMNIGKPVFFSPEKATNQNIPNRSQPIQDNDFQNSAEKNLEQGFVSPCEDVSNKNSFNGIVPFSDEWDEELSPIAPSRESASPRAKIDLSSSGQQGTSELQKARGADTLLNDLNDHEEEELSFKRKDTNDGSGVGDSLPHVHRSRSMRIGQTHRTSSMPSKVLENDGEESLHENFPERNSLLTFQKENPAAVIGAVLAKERFSAPTSEKTSKESQNSAQMKDNFCGDSKTPSIGSPLSASRTVEWESPNKWTTSEAVNLSHESKASEDFTIEKKQLGATSSEFIQQIRGAAHRRKIQLTRSRDSLVAKEREQREAIAAAKKMLDSIATPEHRKRDSITSAATSKRTHSDTHTAYKPFKAKAIPTSCGYLGNGGLSGVPKVETRPTTTPFSPLLGARRKSKLSIKSLEKPASVAKVLRESTTISKSKISSKGRCCSAPRAHRESISVSKPKPSSRPRNNISFKARPLPPTTGDFGHGGQSGLPKVPKRPVTIPLSPLLGVRRTKSVDIGKKSKHTFSNPTPLGRRDCSSNRLRSNKSQTPANDRSGARENEDRARCRSGVTPPQRSWSVSRVQQDQHPQLSPQIGDSSPSLIGLNLLKTTPRNGNDENEPPMTPCNARTQEYTPHSTVRAKNRAEFDSRRLKNVEVMRRNELQEKEKLIRRLRKQIEEERKQLRRNSHWN